MTTCCGTSFLYAIYGADAHTERARQILRDLGAPVTITGLTEFELTNALFHAEWRGILEADVALNRLRDFSESKRTGRLQVTNVDSETLSQQAARLPTAWTRLHGNRSFDILHVAAALVIGADVFLTFDERQRALAAAEGLRTEI